MFVTSDILEHKWRDVVPQLGVNRKHPIDQTNWKFNVRFIEEYMPTSWQRPHYLPSGNRIFQVSLLETPSEIVVWGLRSLKPVPIFSVTKTVSDEGGILTSVVEPFCVKFGVGVVERRTLLFLTDTSGDTGGGDGAGTSVISGVSSSSSSGSGEYDAVFSEEVLWGLKPSDSSLTLTG